LFASRTTVNSATLNPWALAVLPLCFALSGCAAIVYQIAWARQLALVFGTTEVAVTVVLASYMSGLALGGWLIQRFLPFIERPALTYAALELLIAAAAAFAVPALITGSDDVLHALAGGSPDPPGGRLWMGAFYAAAAFVALVIPTLCMGATLPLLTRHLVDSDRQTGSRVGALYACNSGGAVAGALLTTYSLLPNFGLLRTVWSAAALNVLAAVLALAVAQGSRPRRSGFSAAWAAASRVSFAKPPSPAWVLPLMLVSGGVGMFHEVLWTRLLTHTLGSSLHAFGLMLASFLGGLALGAAVGALLAQDRRWAVAGFATSQSACGLSAAAAYILVDRLLPQTPSLALNTVLTVTILVPIAFFSGGTFPLAVRILARRAEDAGPATARVYAWNTLGSIIGVLLGGFVLIPSLRFEGSIYAAVLASLILAVGASLLLQRPSRLLPLTVGIVALITAFLFRPAAPISLLRASPLHISNTGRMLYYGIGQSASVVVLEQDGALALRTNGLPEALIDLRGAPPHVSGEKWLVPLAILTHSHTNNLLMVGYGGGVVLEGIPQSVGRVDVIELEPRVIAANEAIRQLRKEDPLADSRTRITINDARVALDLTDRRYDAIISQPSHPWTAAASHLYTREFLRQAQAHLSESGVFVQWMNVSFIDESLLRSFAATVLDVFADARLYRPDPFTLIFVAGSRVGSAPSPLEAFPQFGINTPEDVFVALAADGQALQRISRGAPLITDDRNRMATTTAYFSGTSMTPASVDRFLAPYDPIGLMRAYAPDIDAAYVARRLAALSPLNPGLRSRLDTLASVMDASSNSAYQVNAQRLEVVGDPDAAQELLQQALARHPDSDPLRFLYIKPWLTRLARGTASREVTQQAAKLTRSADAVLRGTLLAERQRWDEVGGLEDLLAQARWNDPWKLDALALQVQWRCQMAADTRDVRRQRGEEALALVDKGIAAQPAIMLYALRVQSAVAAQRPDAVVESIWAYGHGLFANGTATRVTLQKLLSLLDQQRTDPPGTGADPARIAEVRDGLLNDLRELSR
jgi:predicted membrane-bound spermidine synthase